MTFKYEADFEEAFIKVLADKGWEKETSYRTGLDNELGKNTVR